MKKYILIALLFFSLFIVSCKKNHTKVVIETSLGNIHVELYDDKAPVTVKNFLSYVDDQYYDGTIFHRVISNFMIQGGGYTVGMEEKTTNAPITNEAANGLSNKRGTIAMARTMMVHSATSQFFINVQDNHALDYRDSTPQGFGYCVFGHVTEGMDVVDHIKAVPTQNFEQHQNVPIEPVTILRINRVK